MTSAIDALRELIALKDLKDECLRVRQRRPHAITRKFPQELLDMEADYRRRKPLAWAAARQIVAANTQPFIMDPCCHYLAQAGSVCNKCGRIHKGATA